MLFLNNNNNKKEGAITESFPDIAWDNDRLQLQRPSCSQWAAWLRLQVNCKATSIPRYEIWVGFGKPRCENIWWKRARVCASVNPQLLRGPSPACLSVSNCTEVWRQEEGRFTLVRWSCCLLPFAPIALASWVAPLKKQSAEMRAGTAPCLPPSPAAAWLQCLRASGCGAGKPEGFGGKSMRKQWHPFHKDERGLGFNYKNLLLWGHSHQQKV